MSDSASTAGVILALTLFCIGVIYQCGRLSARVESLESWRAEVREDFKAIRAAIEQLSTWFRGAGAP